MYFDVNNHDQRSIVHHMDRFQIVKWIRLIFRFFLTEEVPTALTAIVVGTIPTEGGGGGVPGVLTRSAPHPSDGTTGRAQAMGQLSWTRSCWFECNGPDHDFTL